MVEINFSALVFTLSFIVFLGLMQLLFFAPVASKIDQREREIGRDKNKTKSLVQEIEEKISKFKDDPEVLAARKEANELINSAKTEAQEAKNKLVAQISNELKDSKETKAKTLEQEQRQIIKNLEGPIKEITSLMVSKLVSGANIKLKEEQTV